MTPVLPPTRSTPAARPRTSGTRTMTDRIVAMTALLGAIASMVAGAIAYGRSQERIDATTAAVGTLSTRADGTEARLRAVEQAQASTATSIQDIAGDIHDIKTALQRHGRGE